MWGAAKGSFAGSSRRDPVAGLVAAVVAIPDGLAAAAMLGVNPVLGLYASSVAPTVGGLLTSSQLMMVATTSASAVAAAETLSAFRPDLREQALGLLVVLVGSFLLLLGLLRAGRMVRFVSHAVMTGFLLGVAVALIWAQLPSFFGWTTDAGSALNGRAFNRVDPHTLMVGLASLGLIVVTGRTRLAIWSPLIALVLPTVAVYALGWQDVRTVGDTSQMPLGFPLPGLPDFGLISWEMVGSALAIAVVIAIQGAGVSQSVVNPDRRPSNVSRDMVAQGVANCASGLFSGIVVGGSIGQTALNSSLGATSRWASVSAGIWMFGVVMLVPHLVAMVPMCALAAIMISAGIAAMDWREALSIWRVSASARLAIALTFATSLITSVPIAVGVGVLCTMIIFIVSSASDASVRMLERDEEGRVIETDPPLLLESEKVTTLNILGSMFFAGARTLQEKLPNPEFARRPVVVLRLRGHGSVGATFIQVLDTYASQLAHVGGALYLSGVNAHIASQLERSGKFLPADEVHVVAQSPEIGISTETAVTEARLWLAGVETGPASSMAIRPKSKSV